MTHMTKEAPAMDDEPVSAPRTLRELRRSRNMTRAQVASRMGVTTSRVAHIEATFPHVRYDTLTRYLTAIGGGIQFIVGRTRVLADQLVPDPVQRGTREYLMERTGKGGVVYVPSAKELPLESDTPEASDDDSGRDVDHADAEGDQGDGGQGEEA